MQRRTWQGPALSPSVGDKILINYGASSCQQLLEVVELKNNRVLARRPKESFVHQLRPEEINCILGPTETLAATMWAGGWDDYVVDTAHIRPLNEEEREEIERTREHGGGLRPEHKGWLLGIFAKRICTEGQCVKVITHLGGGD